jgi:hypothetical protein
VVDGGGLENRWTGNGPGGSNPSPSATLLASLVGGGASGLQARRDSLAARRSPLAASGNESLSLRHLRSPEHERASGGKACELSHSAKGDLTSAAIACTRCAEGTPPWLRVMASAHESVLPNHRQCDAAEVSVALCFMPPADQRIVSGTSPSAPLPHATE